MYGIISAISEPGNALQHWDYLNKLEYCGNLKPRPNEIAKPYNLSTLANFLLNN